MKKHLLEQIGRKIEHNKVTDMLGTINQFLDKKFGAKDNWNVNLKTHTMQKKWSPMEKQFIKMTRKL